jgi:hypothetical protein
MAIMATWARHSVVAHFVIVVVDVVGSVAFDLPVAVFPQSFASYSPWSRLGHVAGYWSSVAVNKKLYSLPSYNIEMLV